MSRASYVVDAQEIVLSLSFEALSSLHPFIENLVSKAPGDRASLLTALRLIGHEIFTNCLFHSGLDPSLDKIIFRGELGKEGVILECRDNGVPFELANIPLPNFSGEAERGFGLYLISQLADRMVYLPKTVSGHNVFRAEKRYLNS